MSFDEEFARLSILTILLRGATPVIEETVIGIVDEPLPGVMRVTEIEETELRVPDTEEEE